MAAKATNDAVAFIRSLAEMRGRNADWAEQAVREAASLSATQARQRNVIDLVADDPEALLAAIDGRRLEAGGVERTLATGGLPIEAIEPGALTRVLSVLSNPNVAFLLMIIGVYGLIFEFSNPGIFAPGVIGVICLVLGLYALNQLPLDYAGLALVMLGIAFMVAEAFTLSSGALGLGGLVAFIIGAAMLIDTEAPAYRISWWVIGGAAAFSAAFLILLLGYAWRAQRLPPVSGAARLVGAEARVLDWSDGTGHVWAEGERWRARGERDLAAGASARIRGIDGITLVVGRAAGGNAPSGRHRHGNHGFRLGRLRRPGAAGGCVRLRGGQDLPRIRTRRGLYARPLHPGVRPRPRHPHPDHPAGRAHRSPHPCRGRSEPGRDLSRQRLGEGERGALLPGHRPRARHHQCGELQRRDQPARPDDATLGARQARARRDAGRA